jgi:hypothetical protein
MINFKNKKNNTIDGATEQELLDDVIDMVGELYEKYNLKHFENSEDVLALYFIEQLSNGVIKSGHSKFFKDKLDLIINEHFEGSND